VLPDDAAERLLRDRSIHERFWGLKAAVDVVRFASSDFDARAAHVAASLPATILREGKLLYDVRRIVLGQTVRSTAALLFVELDEQF
jgi:hypothetical protein